MPKERTSKEKTPKTKKSEGAAKKKRQWKPDDAPLLEAATLTIRPVSDVGGAIDLHLPYSDALVAVPAVEAPEDGGPVMVVTSATAGRRFLGADEVLEAAHANCADVGVELVPASAPGARPAAWIAKPLTRADSKAPFAAEEALANVMAAAGGPFFFLLFKKSSVIVSGDLDDALALATARAIADSSGDELLGGEIGHFDGEVRSAISFREAGDAVSDGGSEDEPWAP